MITTKPFTEINLHDLADVHGPERAFVSLYLAGPDSLKMLDQRVRRVREILSCHPVELEHFNETMKLIEAHLEQEPLSEGARCIFASWALDLLKAYELSVPPPDRLWIGSSLYLRPLAELQDEYERFVVVAADNDSARIFTVTSLIVEDEDRVNGGVKNHVKKGGWSQQRYERRRDKELQQYAAEIVERLGEIEKDGEFDRLVLVGSSETMIAIQEELTPALQEKFIGEKPVEIEDDDDDIWRMGLELFEAAEREDEKELWERIQGEYMQGGRAAVGSDEVLEAAVVGRVEKMIVIRDLKLQGIHCRSCDNIMNGTTEKCTYCESNDVYVIDLVNELVDQLARTSAETEFADEIPGLVDAGGIAALLRY